MTAHGLKRRGDGHAVRIIPPGAPVPRHRRFAGLGRLVLLTFSTALLGALTGLVVGVNWDRIVAVWTDPRPPTALVGLPNSPTVPEAAARVDRILEEQKGRPKTTPSDEIVTATALGPENSAPAVGKPAWLKYAAPSLVSETRPLIALVFDDLGMNLPGTRRAIDLPAPVTLAFLSYAEGLAKQVDRARAGGHELMLHLPMEPLNPTAYPGPLALLTDLPEAEIEKRVLWALDRFEGYVGVNNHMGSRFTASEHGMTVLMNILRSRGLLFVDSLTTHDSLGVRLARDHDVPYAARDVFIDHEPTPEAIRASLDRLEEMARRNGSAIGIAHPHAATLGLVEAWLATVAERGFALVPVSAVVRYRYLTAGGGRSRTNSG